MTEHVTFCDTSRHAGTKELKVSQKNLLRKPLNNMKIYQNFKNDFAVSNQIVRLAGRDSTCLCPELSVNNGER